MAEGRFRIVGDASGVENVFHQISDVMGGFDSIARGANDSAAALGVSLDDLVPGAEEATRQFGELAGGLESVARGFSDLTSVAKALGVAAAPVAVAAAAIGTAWVVTKNQIEAAEEPTNIINARLTEQERLLMLARQQANKYTSAWEGFTAQAGAIQDQIDLINGALTEQEFNSKKVEAALRGAAEPAIQSNQKLLATLEGTIRAQRDLADSLEAGSSARKTEVDQLNGLRKVRRELIGEIEAQEAALDTAILQSDLLATHTALSAEAAEREALARSALAGAKKKEATATRDLLAEIEALGQTVNTATITDEQQAESLLRLQTRLANERTVREAAHADELKAAERQGRRLAGIVTAGAASVAAGEATIREASIEGARAAIAAVLAEEAAKYAALAAGALIAGRPVEAARLAAAAASFGVGGGIAQAADFGLFNGTGTDTRNRSGQR